LPEQTCHSTEPVDDRKRLDDAQWSGSLGGEILELGQGGAFLGCSFG
jgi:hypothetical protein